MNVMLVGEVVIAPPCDELIVTVTGSVAESDPAVTEIDPVYVPAAIPLVFAVTTNEPGMLPDPGLIERNDPPLATVAV